MTIPAELLNYDTLSNVVCHFYKQTKRPLSEMEAVCLDAVLDTGLTRKQGPSKTMRSAPCPADTLRWIVGVECSNFRYHMATLAADWRSLVQWHNDPISTEGIAIPRLRSDARRGGDYQSGLLMTLIAAHRNPDRSPLYGIPEHIFIPVEYQHTCYGLLRCVLQQRQQNTNDLLRLLSGHLPEPSLIPVPKLQPVNDGVTSVGYARPI